MLLNRRQLIISATAFSSSLAIPRLTWGEKEPAWNRFPSEAVGNRLIVGSERHVHFFDAQTLEHKAKVEVGFLPHAFCMHPRRPTELWVIQRYPGKDERNIPLRYGTDGYRSVQFKAVGIDLTNGEIAGEILAPKGSDFRGHGYFVPDSDTLFIARYDMDRNRGHLTGYDVQTGRRIEDYHVSESPTHEAQYMPDGTVMFAANGLGRTQQQPDEAKALERGVLSGVYRIDAKNGKTLTYSLTNDVSQHAAHFRILKDGRIIAVSRSIFMEKEPKGLPGSIFMGTEGDVLKTLTVGYYAPSELQPSEMFSIALDDSQSMALVTDYVNGNILNVDIEKQVVRQVHYMPGNFGMVCDVARKRFITYGKSLKILDSNMKEIQLKSLLAWNGIALNGSHAIIV